MNSLAIELSSHLGSIADVAAVHEPEPGRDSGGETDAVVDEGEGR